MLVERLAIVLSLAREKASAFFRAVKTGRAQFWRAMPYSSHTDIIGPQKMSATQQEPPCANSKALHTTHANRHHRHTS
jgi:hypothetical protein